MASVVGKTIKGNTYYYLATSARVEGKPRIAEQTYLGTAAEIAQAMAGATRMPTRSRHLAFGDLAAAWHVIEKLGVVEIVDEVAGPRRADAGASVGTYLALATLNRVVDPCSKSAFADWWAGTAGDRLLDVPPAALDSRRHWDATRQLDAPGSDPGTSPRRRRWPRGHRLAPSRTHAVAQNANRQRLHHVLKLVGAQAGQVVVHPSILPHAFRNPGRRHADRGRMRGISTSRINGAVDGRAGGAGRRYHRPPEEPGPCSAMPRKRSVRFLIDQPVTLIPSELPRRT